MAGAGGLSESRSAPTLGARGASAVLATEGLQTLRRCWRVYGRHIDHLIGRRMTSTEARSLADLLRHLLERSGNGRGREA